MSQCKVLSVAGAGSIGAATVTSADQGDERSDRPAGSLLLVFDVTALAGTAPSLQAILELKDPVSGKYISFGTFTAVTATGTYTYVIGLGVGAAADGITTTKNFPPPDTWRVRVVGGGTAITNASYTVSAHSLGG